MMTLLTLSTLFFGNIPNEAASLNPPAGEQQVVAAEPQAAPIEQPTIVPVRQLVVDDEEDNSNNPLDDDSYENGDDMDEDSSYEEDEYDDEEDED